MSLAQYTEASWFVGPISARAGVGLKPQHYTDVIENPLSVAWFEVHPENYMGSGGLPHHYLSRIRENYPLSMHGVGLSIGSHAPLNREHLMRLKALCDRYEPELVSEHLAWSTHDEIFLNDLLPLPYNSETAARVAEHITEVQDTLERQILLENPSTYVVFANNEMNEIEFLTNLVRHTGCGLLLDVNNVHVSATNHAYDAEAYIDGFPIENVGEIHLAGYAETRDEADAAVLIDAHDREVAAQVWSLYDRTIKRAGPRPTLIEWDNNVPSWLTLVAEARKADIIIESRRTNYAASC